MVRRDGNQANVSAAALWWALAMARASAKRGLPRTAAASLGWRQGRPSCAENRRALLSTKVREQRQHERIGVGAKLDHEERRPLRHKAGNEARVAAQAIEL